MDWTKGSQYIMNFGVNVDSICSNLGYVEDGFYIPSDDCEENLIELLKNLKEENSTQRTYRRQLCFSRVVELDIIPLIKYIRDQPEVFSAAIRFLTFLIQPVECLTLGMPNDINLPWLADVKRMLLETKKLCTDKDLINSIVSEMMLVIEDHDGEAMSEDNCDFINKCLLLFRNLLYIQEEESYQNEETIILFLLESKIGVLINRLVTISQREYWSASIIQLVSLMYTKHTLEILKPCLSQDDFSDNSSSCDSEDLELIQKISAYPDNDSQNSSSASLTGMFGKSLQMTESSGMSDQVDVERLRNDGDEEDMLVNDEQTDKGIENFRQLLLQFTHDFIVEGFGYLAHDLKNILISDMKDCLDDTYFLWAMAFFLKIARRENAPFRVIRLVLTTELFGFLAYEGVILIEQLLIAKKKNNDMTNSARRLHLTISALNELLKTLSKYSSIRNMENCDTEYLTGLQKDLANITDLRMMFILIFRHFQTQENSPCLLEDLITTNHSFLELMDKWNGNGWTFTEFDIVDHIKMFGTRNIMNLYGSLLKNFENNSCFVNKCVFTMMHHVAGDCEKLDTLLQVPIIESLMEVDGSKNHMTREMIDLTEYVLNTFMTVARDDPIMAAVKLYGLTETDSDQSCSSSHSRKGSTDSTEIDDMLFSLHTELQNDDCMVDKMVERFADIGISVTIQEVWSSLHGNGLITDSEYYSNKALSGMKEESEKEYSSDELDVIEQCVQALKDKNQQDNLKWIQTLLCETAYVKLGKQYERNMYEEPVTMFHVARGSSVPLVLYKEEQEVVLTDHHFKTLLHYMGFHTPQDVDMIFPRIPSFWTSEQLIKQAEKLGPLSSDILKFDPDTVKFEEEQFTLPSTRNDVMSDGTDKSVGFPRVKDSDTNIFWLKQIQQYNMAQQMSANFHNE